MTERTWVSHYIVPCPGNSTCKHCKPGEPHPPQHSFSKLVRDSSVTTSPSSMSYVEPPNLKQIDYLRRRKLMGVSFGNLDPVPFDPELDPQPYACFICWSLLHMTRHCQETPTHVYYCVNCGRRDVLVEKCPRCARAYQERRKEMRRVDEESREFRRALNRARWRLREEDLGEVDSTRESSRCEYEEDKAVEIKSAKRENVSHLGDDYSNSYKDTRNVTDSNELFTFMRNQKMQEQLESELKSFNRSESEYYFYDDDEEEDENYDVYVVDENERSESLGSENYTVRFFLDCLDALKDLSIEMQTSALLNFVAARKKQLWQRQVAKEIC